MILRKINFDIIKISYLSSKEKTFLYNAGVKSR